MSNALAIAHVTQALALLIETNLPPDIDIAVKVEPRKPPADPPAEPTITVFLYQVTPNTSQRNNDLPTRASDGTLVRRAAAPLDLHYLISAYGEESELVGQRLIGSVVRTLHEIPVLPKDIIELAGERAHLSGSNLAEAAQRVRFTPNVMDVDETSKLWGMLHQTPYTLSVVYQAALVFIDGREIPVPGRPVERTEVRVLPFGAPGAPVPPGPMVPSAGTELVPAPGGGEAPVVVRGGASVEVRGEAPAETQGKAVAKAEAKPPVKGAAKSPAKAIAASPAEEPARKEPARSRRAGRTAQAAKTSKTTKSGRTARSAGSAPPADSSEGERTTGAAGTTGTGEGNGPTAGAGGGGAGAES